MADEDRTIPLSNVITIDDERIRGHLDRVVRGTVEETLNAPVGCRGCGRRNNTRKRQAVSLAWSNTGRWAAIAGELQRPKRPRCGRGDPSTVQHLIDPGSPADQCARIYLRR